jgi:hypothetical protein
MPSIRDLWPDRWLNASHLQSRRPIVTIEAVTVEPLYNPRTKKHEPKLILSFYGKDRRLPLNKTQAQAIADITGSEDYTDWPGHQIVLSAGIAPNKAATIVISPLPDRPNTEAQP